MKSISNNLFLYKMKSGPFISHEIILNWYRFYYKTPIVFLVLFALALWLLQYFPNHDHTVAIVLVDDLDAFDRSSQRLHLMWANKPTEQTQWKRMKRFVLIQQKIRWVLAQFTIQKVCNITEFYADLWTVNFIFFFFKLSDKYIGK